MSNEITKGNLDHTIRLIKVALAEGYITPIVGVKCLICGSRADLGDVRKFTKGAVPLPDPLPLEARVRGLMSGEGGKVIENKVINLAGGHRHRRIVTIKPDGGGGRDFCQIEEDYDDCSERFVLESEWAEWQ